MFENKNAVVFAPQHCSKKAYLISIIALLTRISQCWRYKRLTQAINRQELTTSLEILVERGIEGDLALFIIANLQNLGWQS